MGNAALNGSLFGRGGLVALLAGVSALLAGGAASAESLSGVEEAPADSRLGREISVDAMQRMLRVRINVTTGEITQELVEVPPDTFVIPDALSDGVGVGAGAGGLGKVEGESSPVEQQGVTPCDVTVTHTDSDFTGGSFVAQGGFAENEMAAASYQLTPGEFPIIIRSTEMVFATSAATVETTTKWSLLLYAGTPDSGQLVETFEADGTILPFIVIPPGTNGVNVQVFVDPSDPDQIVINDNGSSAYTIAYRIDEHNNQTANPCLFAPPSTSNAFPTTDVSGLDEPTQNWLFAVNCGPLGCPAGWTNFQTLPFFCTPSGDWVIRGIYTAFDCNEEPGACCLGLTCEQVSQSDCALIGGEFLGAGTDCTECDLGACCFQGDCFVTDGTTCTDLGGFFAGPLSTCLDTDCTTGACCLPDASCVDGVLAADCVEQGGTFQGTDSLCVDAVCVGAPVPCCFEATGGCLVIGFDTCLTIGGIPGAVGETCQTFVCFPIGACCLPDGTCLGGVSPEDCAAVDGVFQGDGTSCATVECPLPIGACCFASGACVVFTEENCVISGGTWAGPDTVCADNNQNGVPDGCEADPGDCPGDLDASGTVDALDLGILLGAFGSDDPAADVDGSGTVDALDLGILLGVFGSDCGG